MGFDGGAVVRPDFDVDADDPAFFHGLAEARIEDQRAAMRHPGFNDHIRLQREDDFLHPHHVFGKLDHRPAHPGEGVLVFLVPADAHPLPGNRLEGFPGVQVECLDVSRVLERQALGVGVEDKLHHSLQSIRASLIFESANRRRFSSR